MKINRINSQISTSIYKNTQNKNNAKVSDYKSSYASHVYPKNYYTQSFKGKNIPLAKLYEEYNWYINCDRVPAVNSFLKMDGTPEVMNEFLTEILNTKDRGFEFIHSIVSQPRNTDKIIKGLAAKLGPNSQHLLTFIPGSPYNNAYANYIETIFQNAHCLSELLRIRPDWRGSALIEKHKMLTGNENLTIGSIPKPISESHLYKIFDYLKEKADVGVKQKKDIPNLILDGKTYEFQFFTEGKSSKNVFGIFVPSAGKKYIIKMEEPEKRSLDAPFALGTLAKIDTYLTVNRSRNSAPLCFYDHQNNFSVYKYIEHANVEESTSDLSLVRSKLPDFRALGLDYNDTVGYQNFFVLNSNSSESMKYMEGYEEALTKSEWISVDNDHVTYNNRLQPNITKYIGTLPNGMGIAVF